MSFELNKFLNQHRIIPEDKESVKPTHWAQPNPGVHRGGSFRVEQTDLEDFYQLISNCNKVCAINEVHQEKYSPILIDLDFKRGAYQDDLTEIPRLYTQKHIKVFLQELYLVIAKYCPDVGCCSEFVSCVMEKSSSKYNSNLKMIKDGLHIVFPRTNLPYSVLHLIRNEMIANPIVIQLFKDMKLYDQPSRIYDQAVIQRNAWMIYGTAKPGSFPYQTTSVYAFSGKHKSIYKTYDITDPTADLMFLFSIQRERRPSSLFLDENQYQILYDHSKNSKIPYQTSNQIKATNLQNT